MQIEALKLYNFRNLVNQEISLCPAINFIIGLNGQGKTNLIEAIHLVSVTKSFRTAALREVIKWGELSAALFGKISAAGTIEERIEYELGLNVGVQGKETFINGQKAGLVTDYYGKLPSVAFSPTDIALVSGGPQMRRRFVDRYLADLEPAILPHMMNYNRALKSKSHLLRENCADEAVLEPWNRIMAESAFSIKRARSAFVERLGEEAALILKFFAGVDGDLELNLISDSNSAQEESPESVYCALNNAMRREILYKTCLFGPHRDEIQILLNGKPARAFASQGQARSITLALKLAVMQLMEKEKESAPILLLDDVDSELDEARSRALFRFALQPGRQVFITGIGMKKDVLNLAAELRILSISDGVARDVSAQA